MTKIFRPFLVKIFFLIFLQKLTWFPKNSGLPGGLLYVCYGILVKILNFTTGKPGRIPHFQIWSKMAKFAKKPQKWHFLAVLSTLSQIFCKKLFFQWFWAHSEQKKSLFFFTVTRCSWVWHASRMNGMHAHDMPCRTQAHAFTCRLVKSFPTGTST